MNWPASKHRLLLRLTGPCSVFVFKCRESKLFFSSTDLRNSFIFKLSFFSWQLLKFLPILSRYSLLRRLKVS